MQERRAEQQAHFFDVDGVLCVGLEPIDGYEVPLRGRALWTRLSKHTLIPNPQSLVIPHENEYTYSLLPSDRRLSSGEAGDLHNHIGRLLYKDVGITTANLEAIVHDPTLIGAKTVLFTLNTGRKNQRDWVNVTYDSLKSGGFPTDILDKDYRYFRPDKPKLKSKEAKWLAIKHFLSQEDKKDFHVTHYDDDPEVAFYLAAQAKEHARDKISVVLIDRFPRMGKGVLFSQKELDQYQGILRRELSFGKAISEQMIRK